MSTPIYAIGDIHGQRHKLDRALDLIEADGGPDARIVFLGDYTDRGPDSAGVLDRLIAGKAAGKPWTFLMGNHDRMFAWFLEEVPRHDPHLLIGYHWFHERIGGRETLAAYGLTFDDRTRLDKLHAEAKRIIPQAHADFLQDLTLWHKTDALLFVHAGLRPGIALADQSEKDLLWIRDEFLSDPAPHPWLVVHGHTALHHPAHCGNRVNLDGGAGYGRPLHPAVFEGRDCWLLTETGRDPLRP